jgi:hypothetical protein
MSQRQAEYKPTAGFPEPNYTQTPNDLFAMLPDMSEAELRVTLVAIRETFGFHRDGFKMGVAKLAKAAGLSRQGALDGATAAEKRGTFRRTNPDAITEAEWELVVTLQPVDPQPVDTPLNPVDAPLQPVEGSPQSGRGQAGVKESINKDIEENKDLKNNGAFPEMPLEWKLLHNQEVTEQDLDASRAKDEAPKMFEKAFGFGSLPWRSSRVWEKFEKFVVAIYMQDRFAFGNYVIWRADASKGGGKYTAMSNKQIRLNPQIFMDTGWPDFTNGRGSPQTVDGSKYLSGKYAEFLAQE